MTVRRLTVSRHHLESRVAFHRRPQWGGADAVPAPAGPPAGRGGAIGANVRVEVSAGRLVVELAELAPTEPRR